MSIFFIQENDKPSIFKFKNIKQKDHIIEINKPINKINEKKKIKIVNEIKKILVNNKCKYIVLSNFCKQNEEFYNLFISNNINIVNGKRLFKKLIPNIVKEIIKNNNLTNEETEIIFATNECSKWIEEYIEKLAKEYKRIGIVTNYISNFKKIEEKLYEENGILINVTNNKKRSLIKANIIFNIDFSEELINKFSINDNAIIISIEDNVTIKKKRFCGKIFNNYALKIKDKKIIYDWYNKANINIEKYDLNDIVEIYLKISGDEMFNNIKPILY